MYTFERTHDYERVRELVTDPRVYRSAQPYHPRREDWIPPGDSDYIAVSGSNGWLGVFVLDRRLPVRWEVHLAMAPETWGRSAEICREFVRYLRENSVCEELEAYVPVQNRLARKLALDAGMCECGNGKFEMKL